VGIEKQLDNEGSWILEEWAWLS